MPDPIYTFVHDLSTKKFIGNIINLFVCTLLNGFNYSSLTHSPGCLVGWGCRIDLMLLWRGIRPCPNEYPRYDTKQFDGKFPVMLEFWGMWSTPLLPSLLGPLRPGEVAPDKALSMGQIVVGPIRTSTPQIIFCCYSSELTAGRQ